jgi:hypothetical protein
MLIGRARYIHPEKFQRSPPRLNQYIEIDLVYPGGASYMDSIQLICKLRVLQE